MWSRADLSSIAIPVASSKVSLQARQTFASALLSAPVWVASMMGRKDWTMIVRTYG